MDNDDYSGLFITLPTLTHSSSDRASPSIEYQVDRSLDIGTGIRCQNAEPGQFYAPNSVCYDPDHDQILVTDSHHRVQFMDAKTRKPLWSFGVMGNERGELYYPQHMSIQPFSRFLAVCEQNNRRIQFFSLDYDENGVPMKAQSHMILKEKWEGTYVINSTPTSTFSSPTLHTPSSIHCDTNGNSFVTDSGNHVVHIYDAQARRVRVFGSPGKKMRQFLCPNDVCTSQSSSPSSSFVCIGDGFNQRVVLWEKDGSKPRFYLPLSGIARSVCFDKDGYLLASTGDGSHVIHVFDFRKLTDSVSGKKQMEFLTPSLLGVIDGRSFTPASSIVSKQPLFSSHCSYSPGHFDYYQNCYHPLNHYQQYSDFFCWPGGMCVDGTGSLVVADSGNHRVRFFHKSVGSENKMEKVIDCQTDDTQINHLQTDDLQTDQPYDYETKVSSVISSSCLSTSTLTLAQPSHPSHPSQPQPQPSQPSHPPQLSQLQPQPQLSHPLQPSQPSQPQPPQPPSPSISKPIVEDQQLSGYKYSNSFYGTHTFSFNNNKNNNKRKPNSSPTKSPSFFFASQKPKNDDCTIL